MSRQPDNAISDAGELANYNVNLVLICNWKGQSHDLFMTCKHVDREIHLPVPVFIVLIELIRS